MPDTARRVAFVTLGCKVNQTESEAIAEALRSADDLTPADADVVVVNTCTVTGEADHKARKAIRHALALPQAPVVVVTGCLASLDAEGLRALGDRVVVEADKDLVASRVAEVLGGLSSSGPAVNPGTPAAVRPGRTRAQLKVEDGCDAFCTYCIVPYARGIPRPVPVSRVIAEAERLVASGTSEIVLTGINIGRYDDDGARLPDLLTRVAATGVPRIRLSSIEPRDVGDHLLQVAASTPAFCAHLHIPLQSGSDSVLRRMGRPYDTEAFAAIVARARHALPGIAITSDVIVGFPGESAEEFAETVGFAEELGFSRLHVFRYSARAGTPAALMPDQVAPAVKAERSAGLRALGERLAVSYATSHVGTTVDLLVERTALGPGGVTVAEGLTREYVRARVECSEAAAGTRLAFVPSRVDPAGVLVG